MCGRFGLAVPGDALAKLLGLTEPPDLPPRYNIAPTDPVAAVRTAKAGGRELSMLRWGLVPFWADDRRIGAKFINARSETVATKPMFREAFARRRCLVPADGFYEWKRGSKPRIAWHIGMKGGGPFAMAGLWARWRSKDGSEVVESCTVLTTAPNPLVAPLHDRMPVILEPSAYAAWLDPGSDPAALQGLLAAAPAERMECWSVGTHVNHVKNDDPACRVRQELLL